MRNRVASTKAVVNDPDTEGVLSCSDSGQDWSPPVSTPADGAAQVGDLARWNEENRVAILDYNTRIQREGLPLTKYRSLMKRA